MMLQAKYTMNIEDRIMAQCAGLDLLLLLNVSESRHRAEIAAQRAQTQQAAAWFCAALSEADAWHRAARYRGETIERQALIIADLRRQLTTAVQVADAANRDAASAVRTMEAAGALSGRLRGLLLRVAACEGVAMPSDLFYELQALAVELANDGGRVAKDCNDKESQ